MCAHCAPLIGSDLPLVGVSVAWNENALAWRECRTSSRFDSAKRKGHPKAAALVGGTVSGADLIDDLGFFATRYGPDFHQGVRTLDVGVVPAGVRLRPRPSPIGNGKMSFDPVGNERHDPVLRVLCPHVGKHAKRNHPFASVSDHVIALRGVITVIARVLALG